MSDLEDAQLDALLRQHLSAELDGQRGRAEAAFLRHVAAEVPPAPPAGRLVMRFNGRLFGIIGTALAASIAGLWAAPSLLRDHPAAPARPGAAEAAGEPMLRYVHSSAWDGGAAVVSGDSGDPTPARRIIRERLERTRWYDPDEKAWNELTIPRRDVTLMPVDTY